MNEVIIIQMGREEFSGIIRDEINKAMPKEFVQSNPEPPLKGIHSLAKFLGVSPARAQKLKNDGVFPFLQDGRLVLFDPAKVREVWNQYSSNRRRKVAR
jgi:outer membrane protein assembly factor BamB